MDHRLHSKHPPPMWCQKTAPPRAKSAFLRMSCVIGVGRLCNAKTCQVVPGPPMREASNGFCCPGRPPDRRDDTSHPNIRLFARATCEPRGDAGAPLAGAAGRIPTGSKLRFRRSPVWLLLGAYVPLKRARWFEGHPCGRLAMIPAASGARQIAVKILRLPTADSLHGQLASPGALLEPLLPARSGRC